MNPYDEDIYKENGTKHCKKVFVMYIDGDEKLCDGCDKKKSRIASIKMVCGDVGLLCRQCVVDILTVWDEPRALLLEKEEKEEI